MFKKSKIWKWSPEKKIYVQDQDIEQFRYRTPSQSPFQVVAMCQPLYVSTDVANNVWMKELSEEEREISLEKFMGEWYNLYGLVAGSSMVIIVPSKKGLGDQTYVNSFVYLPHIKDKDVIVLSNFTGEGRQGEEDVVGNLLMKMGYVVIDSPYKFEGYPELKHLRDNIYFGGYGFRSDPEVYDWLEKNFEMKIIRLKEKDERLYHLDCSVFVLDSESVMICEELFSKKEMEEVSSVAEVFAVDKTSAYNGICNSLRLGSLVLNASNLSTMDKNDELYEETVKKDDLLIKICEKFGFEVVFVEITESQKSGAMLSCFVAPLNERY